MSKRPNDDDPNNEPAWRFEEEKTEQDKTEEKPPKKSRGEDRKGVDGEGNPFWTISSTKRVTKRQYKGRTLVDIRETYVKDGNILPGRKGISLTQEQIHALGDTMAEILESVDARDSGKDEE